MTFLLIQLLPIGVECKLNILILAYKRSYWGRAMKFLSLLTTLTLCAIEAFASSVCGNGEAMKQLEEKINATGIVVHLHQRDFDSGTLRIKTGGRYILDED